MAVDPEFAAVAEDWTGLCGWRIENFKPVKVAEIGAFHTGDSYLYLYAYLVGTSKLVHRDIYFWQGSTSSTDERGAVAMKAVELDDRFGGSPKQHREVQNHESDQFIGLFDKVGGVRYLDGGVASGFKKVETSTKVDMYRIKGKKRPILQLVPAARSSLNHGDVFIIHAPGKFFLWIGNKANLLEKNKGASALTVLKQTDPKATETRIEDEENEELNAIIGKEGEIGAADNSDAAYETAFVKAIYDANGKELAKDAAVKKAVLSSDALSYVRYGDKIFVYIGKNADKGLKRTAFQGAMKLIDDLKMPEFAPIEVLFEGTEDDDFDLCFQ
ncbi:actin-binding protein, putative [Trichomonas vaginalis G3]|uniref:Actin-binding protein, putative n=1 Tax=Trichomonas vaginalis (strain ATCC PRA-98 / G3) TaxID=412133 RepID=A2FNW2_TRIV3|nr:actin filament capping [Trichomonas vaginalis G3]EAX93415.1 actin-binding protein, putative [Trichomonas vaginalis G3]KAI5531173.1 actin filament capping [Trichomonas vaginalis G3]|eukprot:XP_001306345.1 actin-binding protein [Trichomonas vaginalis G3]